MIAKWVEVTNNRKSLNTSVILFFRYISNESNFEITENNAGKLPSGEY